MRTRTEIQTAARERPFGELLRELADEIATLVRQEIRLARVELVEQLRNAMPAAALFGATMLFGLGACAALTTCLIALLALAMPVWLAAFMVAIAYAIIALVALQRARDEWQARGPLLPETTATIKEDIAWAKTRPRSGER